VLQTSVQIPLIIFQTQTFNLNQIDDIFVAACHHENLLIFHKIFFTGPLKVALESITFYPPWVREMLCGKFITMKMSQTITPI
jgi:hypothetical protein